MVLINSFNFISFGIHIVIVCHFQYRRVGRFCENTHVGAELEELVREAFIEGYFRSDGSSESNPTSAAYERAQISAKNAIPYDGNAGTLYI